MSSKLKQFIFFVFLLIFIGSQSACFSAQSMVGATNIEKDVSKDSTLIHEYSSLNASVDISQVPVMYFEKRDVDLKKVRKGEKRQILYPFTNRGGKDLNISIISACECTTTNVEDLRIQTFAPGQSGILEVVFDSSEKDLGELIDIEIMLEQTEPNTDIPIIEKVYYKFEIEP